MRGVRICEHTPLGDGRDASWLEEALLSFMHEGMSRNDYFHRLTKTVLAITPGANAIFMGRTTELILPRDVGLRIRIVAPLKQRIRRFAETREVTVELAGRDMEAIDLDREKFAEKHFGRMAHDPCRFDLIVNRQHHEPSDVVSLILCALKLRGIAVCPRRFPPTSASSGVCCRRSCVSLPVTHLFLEGLPYQSHDVRQIVNRT